MPVQLANARIEGPIPEDFEFDAHLVAPEAVLISELPLATRISRNVEIERANDDSIFKTVSVKETPCPRPEDLDIGPPLQRAYAYTDEEVQELVDSEALCATLGPLPVELVRFVEAERLRSKKVAELYRQLDREKEKEAETKTRTKLLGSMCLVDPVKRVPAQRDRITIPTTYLLCIKNKLCPPLNFFTNDRIETVNFSPQDVHFKLLRPWADEDSSEKVQLLDMPKMITLWGLDDHSSCLTPFRFTEASANLLSALELLCNPQSSSSTTLGTNSPAIQTGDSPAVTYASEYRKHRDFFVQLDNLETTYADWYPFEVKARRDILKGILFDWDAYASEVLLRVRLGELERERRAVPMSHKRPAESEHAPLAKVPRLGRANASPSSRPRQPFRASTTRVPQCLVCGKGHSFRDHPSSANAFEDGKPFFARARDNAIWTVKPHKGGPSKRLCILYNLNKYCDNRHGSDVLHLCSLCGGQHAAFERNPACDRTFDGYIQA